MRKSTLALVGFIIGIIGFTFRFVPNVKFFSFFITLIILCIILSSKNDYFNMNLCLSLLFIYFIISSNLITFDSSHPVNINLMINFTSNIINIITITLLIGVPIFIVLGAIWAFVKGDITKASKAIAGLIMFIGSTMLMFFFFKMANIKLFGITDWVSDFYGGIILFLVELPVNIYNGIDGFLENTPLINTDLPPLPSEYLRHYRQLNFDIMYNSVKTLNYNEIIFTIHDVLPLLNAILCLFIALITISKKNEQKLTDIITKLSQDQNRERRFLPNFSYLIIFYIAFELLAAFIIFLNYKDSWGVNNQQDYLFLGYFSIYLLMALIPLLLMLTTNLVNYKSSDFSNTIKGTLIGLIGLFLITRLFYTQKTITAYSIQDYSKSIGYVVNQFIFVAPAESIFFQVFLPGIVAGLLIKYTKNYLHRIDQFGEFNGTKNYYLNKIEDEIATEQFIIDYYKHAHTTSQDRINLAFAESRLSALQNEKRKLEKLPNEFHINLKSIFGRSENIAYFIIFGVIIPSFLFATMHWIVQFYMNNLDFFIFWLSGLGIIYLAGGMWFTFIAFRYGWLAAILTHAFYNTSTIIMIILLGGI
ncbi:MAG: hypothetical protein ACP6IY_18165 [Promethearchaeia archaeon]